MPVNFAVIIVVCIVFYILNVIVFEKSQKQEKNLINNFSQMSLSMCRLLDSLPYGVVIEKNQEIFFFNSKLVDVFKVPMDEQGDQDICSLIYSKLKEAIATSKDDEFGMYSDGAKKLKRINKTLEKISNVKDMGKNETLKQLKQNQHAALGLAPNEEAKGIDFDKLDSSIDLDSGKSVSESDDSEVRSRILINSYSDLFQNNLVSLFIQFSQIPNQVELL